MNWFDAILFWHWWVLAGALVLLELLRPGFVLLWLGFAAAGVGFLLVLFPSIPGHVQLLLFGSLCAVAVLSWRYYRGLRRRTPGG